MFLSCSDSEDSDPFAKDYPSATSHGSIRPFAQIGSDIRHIKTLLQKLRRHVGAKD
jgi:hypothetical protein